MASGISHWCQRKGRLVVTSGRVYGRAAPVREVQGRGSRSAREEPGGQNIIAGLGLQNLNEEHVLDVKSVEREQKES